MGRANNLRARYTYEKLAQVIYFEEYETPEETWPREIVLLAEFIESGLPYANKLSNGVFKEKG